MTKENAILLGVGVVAFLGVRYLLKKRDEKQSSFLGTSSGGNCSFYSGNTPVSLPCGGTIDIPMGAGSEWNGYTVTCGGSGLGGCEVVNSQGMVVATGTKERPVLRERASFRTVGDGGRNRGIAIARSKSRGRGKGLSRFEGC